jgi:hypothetical protein
VVNEGRKEQAGHNEALFREVNENIAKLESQLASDAESLPVICECAVADCTIQLEIGLAEYANVRKHPDWFIVARGHERQNIEHVVAEGPEYVIVEKLGIAAAAADNAS